MTHADYCPAYHIGDASHFGLDVARCILPKDHDGHHINGTTRGWATDIMDTGFASIGWGKP